MACSLCIHALRFFVTWRQILLRVPYKLLATRVEIAVSLKADSPTYIFGMFTSDIKHNPLLLAVISFQLAQRGSGYEASDERKVLLAHCRARSKFLPNQIAEGVRQVCPP